uniref:RNB domain-containing protein n=1 Tax=Mastacembelus armatus TaxID=205130 RepID=A0A7N8Y259_9TELE
MSTGRQFRAVIMTAVQTRENLTTSYLSGLELFNDPRVLNTAMTRAQSQVVVVGDAAALCCFGKCSGIWQSYIKHCITNSSVTPQHFTKDFFEKDLMETAKFQKSEHVDEKNTMNDAILQELKNEYEQLKIEYCSDEDSLEFEDLDHLSLRSSNYIAGADTVLSELCEKQPELKQNNVFMVQVIGWKENCSFPLGKVIKILPVGKSLDDELKILNEEFKVAPSTYNLDRAFLLADEVGTQREDLRKVMTFTVDSKDTRDLDDAISVREIGDQYELGIHIADVASFVSPGSKLDKDAKQKGATYYCGNRKPIYMFPENLSTEHFSLLPNEDRKVVSLMFKVSKQTNEIIGKHKFQLSVINSNEQLSYDKAGEWITERYGVRPNFSDIKDCVTMAYCFAKSQRKIRLNKDWAYAQPDAKRFPGNRKAQLMIEELSVLFNALVSETLIGSEQTQYCTPLRCQAKPSLDKVEELKETYAELMPLSFLVRHKVDHDEQVKTYMICSSSSPKENIGHYSLNVNSYTQASSPIRRYMDIVLQRLLHSVISNENVYYTPTEITTLCSQFEDKIRVAKEYEIKAEEISYAVSRAKQSFSHCPFVS